MSAFRAGQEVVCVKHDKWRSVFTGKFFNGPAKGDVVRIAVINDFGPRGIGFELDEYPGGKSYHARYFRPLATRKTDISIFTALLNTKSEKELV